MKKAKRTYIDAEKLSKIKARLTKPKLPTPSYKVSQTILKRQVSVLNMRKELLLQQAEDGKYFKMKRMRKNRLP
jgi:hypothetical protein